MTEKSDAPTQPAAAARTFPEVMTVEDLAAYLQVSRKAVYKMAQAGELPAAKVGDQWRFQKALIDRWLAALSRSNYHGPTLPEETGENGDL